MKSTDSEPDAGFDSCCATCQLRDRASPVSLSVKWKSQQHLPHTFVMRIKRVNICQMLRMALARGMGFINVCETRTDADLVPGLNEGVGHTMPPGSPLPRGYLSSMAMPSTGLLRSRFYYYN